MAMWCMFLSLRPNSVLQICAGFPLEQLLTFNIIFGSYLSAEATVGSCSQFMALQKLCMASDYNLAIPDLKATF